MGASAAWHGIFARSSGYNWLCGYIQLYPVTGTCTFVSFVCGYTWLFLYGYMYIPGIPGYRHLYVRGPWFSHLTGYTF
jgi:uncharacterized membrane protein YdcZ (DUF606 family)